MGGSRCDVEGRWVRSLFQCALESASGQFQAVSPTFLCEEIQKQRLLASRIGAAHQLTFGQSLEFTSHLRFCARRVGTQLVRTEDLARVPEENSIKVVSSCVLLISIYLSHGFTPWLMPRSNRGAEGDGGEIGPLPSLTSFLRQKGLSDPQYSPNPTHEYCWRFVVAMMIMMIYDVTGGVPF